MGFIGSNRKPDFSLPTEPDGASGCFSMALLLLAIPLVGLVGLVAAIGALAS